MEREWPTNSHLLSGVRAYLAACKEQDKKLGALIDRMPREMPDHRAAVALVPIALAVAAATSEVDQISASIEDVRGIRILRSFDREWFERVYELTLLACLALGYGSWHLPKAGGND